jgi:hypothetical protein
MSISNDRKQANDQKQQQAYDRAYRRTSYFLAGLAAPIIGRKFKDFLKGNKKK